MSSVRDGRCRRRALGNCALRSGLGARDARARVEVLVERAHRVDVVGKADVADGGAVDVRRVEPARRAVEQRRGDLRGVSRFERATEARATGSDRRTGRGRGKTSVKLTLRFESTSYSTPQTFC